ncbi:MAG: hypothetical protein EXR93_05290 [Gemmatimonadetes bacterium]|nr:hypothetical protein [Gemmatimonadota bacterium]
MLRHSRFRRRLVIPALLSLLHLGTVVVVPVLHGEVEVLSSERAFESGHTDRCAILHIESTCPLKSLPQIAGATARDVISSAPERHFAVSDADSALPSRSPSPANGVRAPPLA